MGKMLLLLCWQAAFDKSATNIVKWKIRWLLKVVTVIKETKKPVIIWFLVAA